MLKQAVKEEVTWEVSKDRFQFTKKRYCHIPVHPLTYSLSAHLSIYLCGLQDPQFEHSRKQGPSILHKKPAWPFMDENNCRINQISAARPSLLSLPFPSSRPGFSIDATPEPTIFNPYSIAQHARFRPDQRPPVETIQCDGLETCEGRVPPFQFDM